MMYPKESGMIEPRPRFLFATALVALVWTAAMGPLRLRADVTAIPLADSQVEEDPYEFNGVVSLGIDGGSGAVVRHPNVVLSCAHVVFDEAGLLDPWVGEARWFWKYHASTEPTWKNGQVLRGYTKFTSYQFTAEAYGINFGAAFAWDIAVHYAYENLAGGKFASGWTNGLSALSSSSPKMVTGYPSGLYPDGHASKNKMHAAGPFAAALQSERGPYLRTDGVTVGPGNSGGPAWVQESSGKWLVAGVVVAAAQKAEGDPVNRIGVRAMDAEAWALVAEAIGVAPPPNDHFAAPYMISAAVRRVTGSNVGGSKEAGEPDHAEELGGKSVWWTWTAPNSGLVTFDTVGSSFDTMLAVYTGNDLSTLSLIASDDESGGEGAGRVAFRCVQGTVYHIAVDGYLSTSGRIVLNLPPPPPNDDFAAPLILPDTADAVTGSNVGAVREAGEPIHAGASGGASVWWTWTAPKNGTVTVDTIGSSFDTLLAVYTGDSVSKLSRIASNDDIGEEVTSRLSFAGVAGTVYGIAVDGVRGASGRIVLHLRQGLHITLQPDSRSVEITGNAVFTVTASGTSFPAYQWRKDGVDLIGATNSAYTITNVQTSHAGAYSVLVQDSAGTVASSNSVLTVTIPYTFTTWAGTARRGSDDGAGSTARFVAPSGVAVDNTGHVFVADSGNNLIRKISPDGTVSTLAGATANPAGSTDATGNSARFSTPLGVAVDNTGAVYVSDTLNHTIRKITVSGVVSTLAGSARALPGETDGTGSLARFNSPNRLASDGAGNLYVADTLNHTIRKITPSGLVSTLAGLAGIRGSANGTGNAARFSFPRGVAVDALGNVNVADGGNSTVRKITPAGAVSTLAGRPGVGGHVDGTASSALLSNPIGIAVDGAGNVYVADDYAHTIRKITPNAAVRTFAGSPGNIGNVDGPGSAARFDTPTGLAVDRQGNLYVADTGNHTIRKIGPDGVVSTLAGKTGPNTLDGKGSIASFATPDGPAVDEAGNVYVADSEHHTLRKITPDGLVSTLAGMAGVPGSADGRGSEARFDHPESPAVDRAGNVYVADAYNHTIRKITPDGSVSTLAGLAGTFGSADGAGSAARFFHPFGVAVDRAGNVYVADGYNHTIRKLTPEGVVSTLAGSPGMFGYADGVRAEARFNGPESLAVDEAGNVFVADYANHVIRKVAPDGTVSTVAGVAGVAGSTDGPGHTALFSNPVGVAVDSAGNLYVADGSNDTIRMIAPEGVVSTLAGSARTRAGSVDGVGRAARFFGPLGLAVDRAGRIYVADSGNKTIRKGLPFAIIAQPRSHTLAAGAGATFSVAAVGTGALTHQWRKDGVSLAGATNSTFTIPIIESAHAGLYSVVVSSGTDSVLSSNALLRVLASPRLHPPQRLAEGQFRLVVESSEGGAPKDVTRLELQWHPDLPTEADNRWRTMLGQFYLTNGVAVFDDLTAEGQPRRFYRVFER